MEAFKQRLRKRAKDKRDAAIDEIEAQEKAKRIEASPGGLDPLEVLESLPEVFFFIFTNKIKCSLQELRDAFETQSMERMFAVAEQMDSEVFQYHLQRCIDSGLW